MVKENKFDPYSAGRKLMQELSVAEGGAYREKNLVKKQWQYRLENLISLRQGNDIISQRIDKGERHYPVWQFLDDGRIEPTIKYVLGIFQSDDSWRLIGYFLQPKKSLGKIPLEVIRAGDERLVLEHALFHKRRNNW